MSGVTPFFLAEKGIKPHFGYKILRLGSIVDIHICQGMSIRVPADKILIVLERDYIEPSQQQGGLKEQLCPVRQAVVEKVLLIVDPCTQFQRIVPFCHR